MILQMNWNTEPLAATLLRAGRERGSKASITWHYNLEKTFNLRRPLCRSHKVITWGSCYGKPDGYFSTALKSEFVFMNINVKCMKLNSSPTVGSVDEFRKKAAVLIKSCRDPWACSPSCMHCALRGHGVVTDCYCCFLLAPSNSISI